MAKSKKTPHSQSVSTSVPIHPLADRVIIKPLPAETKTPSGIIIPDTTKEKPQEGTVVAVGPGKFDECGEHRIPMSVEVGDRVYFEKPWKEGMKIDGVEYYIISESDIIGVRR